jgi:hypothetical protein
MDHYLINTGKKPCTVIFEINAAGNDVPIYILGYDPINKNTLYFRSLFLISGNEQVSLNCPQSPRQLKILVWSDKNRSYQLSAVEVVPLSREKTTDPTVKFVEYFSRIAGRLRPGNYVADKVPFTIQLKRNIYTDAGTVHNTPARIHTELPLIQVSKAKFDDMTVPERVIILLHEVAHNYINSDQDNEVESDAHALDIYNGLGYPKIEAVNAFGNIMSDTDDNYQRMLNLINM